MMVEIMLMPLILFES